MTDLITVTPLAAPDPDQRVKYSLGLVLGADEFEQEQYYFLERSRLHQRGLHGYGTVCGLHVSVDDTTVMVSPGTAVNPQGAAIRVPCAQCANLEEWLSAPANQQALKQTLGALPGETTHAATLYVVLSYDECDGMPVPVPGAPCRSEADILAPSRVIERFDLRLSPTLPAQDADLAVRRLGELLGRVVVGEGPGPSLTAAQIEAVVRGLLESESLPGSLPIAEPLRVHPLDAPAVLRAAFRVWVTEVRPGLQGAPGVCGGQPPAERQLLLARLDFAVDDAWSIVRPTEPGPLPVRVDQTERPVLLPTQLLQEIVLQGCGARQAPSGPPGVVAAGRFTLDGDSDPPPLFSFNGLRAHRLSSGIAYLLAFPGYRRSGRYIVKGTPCADLGGGQLGSVEVVSPDDPALAGLPISPDDGIVVRVMQSGGLPIKGGFMVEISQF